MMNRVLVLQRCCFFSGKDVNRSKSLFRRMCLGEGSYSNSIGNDEDERIVGYARRWGIEIH